MLRRRALLPMMTAFTVVTAVLLYLAFLGFGAPAAGVAAVVGGGVLAFTMFRLPFQSLVWAKGIEGERAAAEHLAPLESEGYILLHNRKVPGSKGDIDHVVIGPTGVAVVETKNWGGRVELRGDRLWVGDHERTWAVDQLYREALAVQVALGDELTRHRVTVTPILCVIGGAARSARSVNGVAIAVGRDLAGLIRDRPPVFDEDEVLEIARAADDRLRVVYAWDAD